MTHQTQNIDLLIRCEALSEEGAQEELRCRAERFSENHEAIASEPYLRLEVSERGSFRYGQVYRAFAVWGGTSGSMSATSTSTTPEDAISEALTTLSRRIRSFERSAPLATAA